MSSKPASDYYKARAKQYARDLRERRKQMGFVQIHWFIPQAAHHAIAQAAEDEDRRIQQYINLNIWKMVPEHLRPKDILSHPLAKSSKANPKRKLDA